MSEREFRALEAATTSANEWPWSLLDLDAGEVTRLVRAGLLLVVQGSAMDPTAAGNVYRLSDDGVAVLRRRMRLVVERCTHLRVHRGACLWCGAFLPHRLDEVTGNGA